MTSRNPPHVDHATVPARQPYEPPGLLWEEDFEPAGQFTGCADVGDNCPDRPDAG